jgi:peptidoglycan L-alanyl-D-glutamate endopeptidase CwlK
MYNLDTILFGMNQMPARSAEELKPYAIAGASEELQTKMFYWQAHMQYRAMPVKIYCVYRSNDDQAKLYAQGRTTPGNIVTNAKPGFSAHNRTSHGKPASDAFDACPMIDGKPTWVLSGEARAIWDEMGRAAGLLGLEWGRHYKRLGGDWSHFEFHRHELEKEKVTT